MSQDKQRSLFETHPTYQPNNPVECLGLIFANEAERRAFFIEELRKKLQDPQFRRLEGFPHGEDEDILALSDPPFYTACPNPWLADFVAQWEAQKPIVAEGHQYHREPFAVDVSLGKTDPIYKAHSYHTKVPHLAIVPSILHYTEPGDIILDGFCGSGMTGVAAQWCGTAPASYRQELEARWKAEGLGQPKWGIRQVILNDLSPAATFIAANYNLPFDVRVFAEAGGQLLDDVESEIGWMYMTRHENGQVGTIDYTVWSEVFSCPYCASEVVFLDEALDQETKSVQAEFPCPHCKAVLDKRSLERTFETRVDPVSGEMWQRVRFRPVLIAYSVEGTRFEKEPDEGDLQLLGEIEQLPWPSEMPSKRLPIKNMYHGSRIAPKGITHVHHFFLPRAAHALSVLWRKIKAQSDTRLRHLLFFFVEQSIWGFSLMNRYRLRAYSHVNQYLTGVYYIPSQTAEPSPSYNLGNKLGRMEKAFSIDFAFREAVITNTGSTATLPQLPTSSIDYIFTDPPFGENIFYADLNFIVEAWHKVLTNTEQEAIVDRAKRKTLGDYERLMQECFTEYYRVLKPGRWMTVVFHNSHNAVWTAIQAAMAAAGFVIADVRTLDKQQGSYRQVTSSAMKQDLVVSAYKPGEIFEERFKLVAGHPESAWEFVRSHLKQVPVYMFRDGKIEPVRERMVDLLYDRMVAFHVLRGISVPLSASEFRQGLLERFAERDEMFFLPEQVIEYDRKRLTARELIQLQIFVTDESSAISWVRQQLTQKPQSFQDLQPQFMQQTKGGWQRYEQPLELRELLNQNFLCYDGLGDVPSQIHSYLSTNYKDLRNLPKNDPTLRTRAKDRWYVPDPSKQADLEKLRERELLREFETYKQNKQRKLKVFRLEAVRAGFKRAWQECDYDTIISVAVRIPTSALQEDPKILMWYDMASMRTGREP